MKTVYPDFLLDEEGLKNNEVSIFDVIDRPKKELEEYSNKELGMDGEHIACAYLIRKGYAIVECNWKCTFGEVDIVAKDPEGTLVLVEVKTSRAKPDEDFILPELNVSKKKQEKYKKLALMYLAMHPMYDELRFDVIALVMVHKKEANLRHLINSFSVDN